MLLQNNKKTGNYGIKKTFKKQTKITSASTVT